MFTPCTVPKALHAHSFLKQSCEEGAVIILISIAMKTGLVALNNLPMAT